MDVFALTTAAVMATGPQSNYTTAQRVTDAEGNEQIITVPDTAAWEAAIHWNAINIFRMAGEDGLVTKALRGIDTTRENVKVFSGVVVNVRKEPSSTRGLVTLFTGTDRDNVDGITKQPLPKGCEQVRTERTDDPIGKSLAIKSRDLIGHKVLVFVEVETIKNGQSKARVLRDVQSIGRDESGDAVISQMAA